MNSLLLRRRCAGAPRVGYTKIYVTGGEYDWFSPETYQDVNHFYFTTSNLVNGYMDRTPYNVSFTIGTVSGIKTNDPSKVKLVYNSNSYTIHNWCFDVVSNVEFTLTPKTVAGKQVWDIIVSFNIEPKRTFCYPESEGDDINIKGWVYLLKLQQYPGLLNGENCYFQIKPDSMYVTTTDDLVTGTGIFSKTNRATPYFTGISTWRSDNLRFDYHDEDDTDYYYYTIGSQTLNVQLPYNTSIKDIYITYDKVTFGGSCYITTAITSTGTAMYTLSIKVSSEYEAFFSSNGYQIPKFKLVVEYYQSLGS